MTSHGCKGKEPLTFMPSTPHFFKIILQNTLDDQKLMVPVKFVKNHGEHLQNQAVLKVPGGATWKVELGKCNGKVWMGKGWKEFADYYSLAHGHFLVFEYSGNSVFYVLIFDTTATEIDYALSCSRSTDHELPHQDVEDSDSEDDKSLEILNECSVEIKKKRERSPLLSPRPQKITKTDTTTKAAVTEQANAFKSQNPFFSVVMQPSYCRSSLNIPYKFVKGYFKENRGEVILRVSNGRAWTVNYGFDDFSGRPKARFYYSSWVAFMKDNNLKVGDVCIFELIKGIEISLQVFIFRRNEEANCRPSINQLESGKSSVGKFDKGSSSSGVPEAAATEVVSPYQFFNFVVRRSSFKTHQVHVPKSFAEKYIKHEKQEILLQVGDSSWRVTLNYNPESGTGKLSAGWMAFARGNSLKVGDVCTFELIKSNVLRVSISRIKTCSWNLESNAVVSLD